MTGSARPQCDSGDYSSTFDRCVTRGALEREGAAAGPADRRPLSWARHRLLHRRRRVGPARERPHRGRARRRRRGLCRLLRGRAGDRDHPGADRRRCAGAAARAHPHLSRLDHLSGGRLRLLRLALDRDGRLRDRARRNRAPGQVPCRSGAAPRRRRRCARDRRRGRARRRWPELDAARSRRRCALRGRHLLQLQVDLHLRHRDRPCGGRSQDRAGRGDRLRGGR